MYSLILVSFVSLVIAVLATRVCRSVCLHFDIVDRPDRVRKLHVRPVPRVGGIAIAIAVIVAHSTLLLLPLRGGDLLAHHLGLAVRLAPALFIVFLTGLVDDLVTIRPWWKLTGQAAAAILAWSAGVRISSMIGVSTGELTSFCLTIVWLVACTNALNLIDGLDGLAAGVGLVATLTAFAAALLQGNMELALVTAPLAGALIGFLRYNFNPASIFLGDCGSLLIGFMLGCFGVIWSQKSATLLGMTAPLMALSIPILDTSLSIARRFVRNQPIFGADRGHIHHRLLDRGLKPRNVVLVLYACAAAAATLSLLHSAVDYRFSGLIVVVFCACVWYGVHRLGYVEFGILRKLLIRGTIRERVNAEMSLMNLHQALAAAEDPGSCLSAVSDTCRHFGYNDVRLSLGGIEYGERPSRDQNTRWSVRIPLSHEDDYIQLNREFQRTEPEALASLADTLRSALEPKIAALRPNDRKVANW